MNRAISLSFSRSFVFALIWAAAYVRALLDLQLARKLQLQQLELKKFSQNITCTKR